MMRKVSTFPRLERLKKRRQTSGLLHFCPLVAFFQKTAVRRKRRSLVSPLSWLMFGVSLPLFGLFFCQRTRGEGKRVLYSLGVTTYLFRGKTLCRKEERRANARKNERERERAFGGLFIYLFIRSIHHSSLRERENFFPFFGRKKASFGRA